MATAIMYVGNIFWVTSIGLWLFTAVTFHNVDESAQRNQLLLLFCAIGIALMGTIMFVGLEIAKPLREIAQTLKHIAEVYDWQIKPS